MRFSIKSLGNTQNDQMRCQPIERFSRKLKINTFLRLGLFQLHSFHLMLIFYFIATH